MNSSLERLWVALQRNPTVVTNSQRVASTPCDSNTKRKECLDSHVPCGPREEQACTVLTVSMQTTPAARCKSSPNPHLRHEHRSNNRNVMQILCESNILNGIFITIEVNKKRNLLLSQRKTCFIFTSSLNADVMSCPCPCLCDVCPCLFPCPWRIFEQ